MVGILRSRDGSSRIDNADLLNYVLRHWIPARFGNDIARKRIANDIVSDAPGCRRIVDLSENDRASEAHPSRLCVPELGLPV